MKVITTTLLVTTLSLMVSCSQQISEPAPKRQTALQQEDNLSRNLKHEKEERDAPSPAPAESVILHEEVADISASPVVRQVTSAEMKMRTAALQKGTMVRAGTSVMPPDHPVFNTESYTPVRENGFVAVSNDPLSTFSVDVDTAAYSNVRRFINSGSLPPVGAVRIEEMVNYFTYAYPQPVDGPIGILTESGPCPWERQHTLVRIGIKARDMDRSTLPPSNLVFLIDVSGSMQNPQKLPLLKKSMKLLVEQLGKQDRVAIVVYAGMERVVLEPTSGDRKDAIIHAIDGLRSSGATHGSRGIITAYQLAQQGFMPKGNNRVILASDGDFNVGVTSRGELENLIKEQRESGVYLTVLGFGSGNYHDDTMETLADKGNGNYAYIDSLLEAKKVMVKEMNGTMFTLARDVKIQVEFNPATVGAYRLIGYENRVLADEDFNDDTRDAGEVGLGHSITALYEIIPPGSSEVPTVDPLRYQSAKTGSGSNSNDLLTVKVRYKPEGLEQSKLVEQRLEWNKGSLEQTSNDFRFAAAVAGYGMVLRGSDHGKGYSYGDILSLARSAKGEDHAGYRAEFIRLVEMTELI